MIRGESLKNPTKRLNKLWTQTHLRMNMPLLLYQMMILAPVIKWRLSNLKSRSREKKMKRRKKSQKKAMKERQNLQRNDAKLKKQSQDRRKNKWKKSNERRKEP
jgi:hypothetical protein